MVGILLYYWGGLFSEAMLISGGVDVFFFHQEFQIPKMQGFLNLVSPIFGGGCFLSFKLYIQLIYIYIGEDSSILGT